MSFPKILLHVEVVAAGLVRRTQLNICRGRRFAKVGDGFRVVADHHPGEFLHVWIRCVLGGHLAQFDLGAAILSLVEEEITVGDRTAGANGPAVAPIRRGSVVIATGGS